MLNDTTYSCEGLQAGRTYEMRIHAFDAVGAEIPSALNSITVKTLPGKVEITDAAFSQIDVTGNGDNEDLDSEFFGTAGFVLQDSADGYQIKIMNSKGEIALARTTSSDKMKNLFNTEKGVSVYNSIFNEGKGDIGFEGIMKKAGVFKIKVRAYQKYKGKRVYGAWSDVAYALRQPVVKARKNSDGSMQFKWDKNICVTGYDLYIVDSKKKVKSTIKLKKFEEYFVRSCGKKTTVSVPSAFFDKGKSYYCIVIAKKKVGKKVYTTSIADSYLIKFKY